MRLSSALAFWLLLLFFSLFHFQKIDLTTADLGQHLKTGEYVRLYAAPLTTNHYSYTTPAFAIQHPFQGVVYDAVRRYFGFEGLTFLNVLLNVLAFALILRAALNYADKAVVAFLAVLALPLITLRTEVRPEFFSLFFLALYFFILSRPAATPARDRLLWLIPFLQILWVNLHIFYIFGPFLVFLYFLQRRTKGLFALFAATLCACAVNPFFLRGAFYFLILFRDASNMAPLENRSTVEGGGPYDFYFQIYFAFFLIVTALAVNRRRKETPWALTLFSLSLGVMGWNFVRMYPLFGFFSVPALAASFSALEAGASSGIKLRRRLMAGTAVLAVLAGVLFPGNLFSPWRGAFGAGLLPGNENSARFFRLNGLKGPIFNNYDIGSFLIYELFPQERVFIDNRGYAAYPMPFLTRIYVPIVVLESSWHSAKEKYGFNAIFWRYNSVTTAAKNLFLMRRLEDPEWALVYFDDRTAILLRRNEKNAEPIRKLEIKPAR